MLNWNIYLTTETEKYDFIQAIRAAGAELTGVSGCGPGYYIQFDATQDQADYIGRTWYRPDIHAMNAAQAWAAWKDQRLTVGQLSTWQQRHGIYFDPEGKIVSRREANA
jgi:hypothetical protein